MRAGREREVERVGERGGDGGREREGERGGDVGSLRMEDISWDWKMFDDTGMSRSVNKHSMITMK